MTEPQPLWETARLSAQRDFDESRPPAERNRMGQFATPTGLARAVLRVGLSHLPPGEPLRFLDPALGTGSFYSALLAERGDRPIVSATGIELDPVVVDHARRLWANTPLDVRAGDFTSLAPRAEDRANLLIANPPYVRHHHLSQAAKGALTRSLRHATGLKVSGLAGLYCYFLMLSRAWMTDDGIAIWLIPSEFMDVNYGDMVKRFLLEQVTLLRIHRADPNDVQFDDALVSSAVVVLQNRPPPAEHLVRFSFGGTLERPALERAVALGALTEQPKWTRYPREADAPTIDEGTPLGELFQIKRGIATGGNDFFVLDDARVAALGLSVEHLTPILPPPRRLPVDQVNARSDGSPELPNRAWLVRCALPEAEVAARHPALWRYLQSGVPEVSSGYLCSRRSPWYAQETRAPAPLLCTYMGRENRGRPFRFILNQSLAIAANVYLLLYPKPALAVALKDDPRLLERIWRFLNSLDPKTLVREGRVYGGGLFKLEPTELAAVRVPHEVCGVNAGPTSEADQAPRQMALGFRSAS